MADTLVHSLDRRKVLVVLTMELDRIEKENKKAEEEHLKMKARAAQYLTWCLTQDFDLDIDAWEFRSWLEREGVANLPSRFVTLRALQRVLRALRAPLEALGFE